MSARPAVRRRNFDPYRFARAMAVTLLFGTGVALFFCAVVSVSILDYPKVVGWTAATGGYLFCLAAGEFNVRSRRELRRRV